MGESSKSIGFSPSYGSDVCEEDARVLTGPFQISLDITNRCNLRCKHCYNASGENYITASDELTDQEVLALAADIAIMRPMNFCFCGGEPLLRKDLLIEATKILKSGSRFVSMVTNGYLVTPSIAQEIVVSGIMRIQVSVDGARAETHERLRGKEGAFNRAINAIKVFNEAGARDVEIAFCPTEEISTVIIVAHKLATVRVADKIVVFERGTIADLGLHQELIERDGFYKRISAEILA